MSQKCDSNFVGLLSRTFFALAPQSAKDFDRIRHLLDLLQPTEPLAARPPGSLPTINIIVPTTGKDFWKVKLALMCAIRACRNPVGEILVVVPGRELAIAKSYSWDATVVAEEEFVHPDIRLAVGRYAAVGRAGWAMQQMIKLYGTWKSEVAGVLVLDSDTILLGHRTYLTESKKQILSFSRENHMPYEMHATRIWGNRRRHRGLSYVTHHMLMQPDIVRQMFPTVGGLVRWLDLGDLSEPSAVADYHSYGRWIADNAPSRYRIARWNNQPVLLGKKDVLFFEGNLDALDSRFAPALSVSSHSYSEK